MKKFILFGTIILSVLTFAYVFSASYNSQNIDRLDYVIAIGIDKTTTDGNIQVSFEFSNLESFSDSNSSDGNKPIIDTVIAPSIPESVNLMNAYASKHVNLSHCKVIVFSDSIAKEGILEEVTYLMNEPQIRPTTNLIIAKDSAKDYIKNSASSLEGILTKYYDIFPTSTEYTGYTSNILLGRFYQSLIRDESGSTAILGYLGPTTNTNDNQTNHLLESLSPNENIVSGDRSTENIGLAVFKDDKYQGDLSAIETLCYTIIEEEVDNFYLNIDTPLLENKNIDLSVSSLEPTRVNLDISGENPVLTIKLNLIAKTLTGQNFLDYSNQKTLEEVNDSLKLFITSKMKDYLYKTSREYGCDINGFFRMAKQKFLTIPEYENYNWAEKYKKAEFNVIVDSSVVSSFLVQNS